MVKKLFKLCLENKWARNIWIMIEWKVFKFILFLNCFAKTFWIIGLNNQINNLLLVFFEFKLIPRQRWRLVWLAWILMSQLLFVGFSWGRISSIDEAFEDFYLIWIRHFSTTYYTFCKAYFWNIFSSSFKILLKVPRENIWTTYTPFWLISSFVQS